jgi:putative flippase GtrA
LLLLRRPITRPRRSGSCSAHASYLLNRAWTFGAGPPRVGRFLVLYALTLVVNVA